MGQKVLYNGESNIVTSAIRQYNIKNLTVFESVPLGEIAVPEQSVKELVAVFYLKPNGMTSLRPLVNE